MSLIPGAAVSSSSVVARAALVLAMESPAMCWNQCDSVIDLQNIIRETGILARLVSINIIDITVHA